MSEEHDNLALTYLRRIDANLDGLKVDFVDLKHRTAALAVQVAQTNASMTSQHQNVMLRMDRLDASLDRIERGLA